MELHDYFLWAEGKEKPGLSKLKRFDHAYIGLIGEIGELADWYKKRDFYDQELNVREVQKELGDIVFYAAIYINANADNCTRPQTILAYPFLRTDSVYSFLREMIGAVNQINAITTLGKAAYLPTQNAMTIIGLVAGFCLTQGWSFTDILNMNYDKLEKRHPSGFTAATAAAKIDQREEDGHAS